MDIPVLDITLIAAGNLAASQYMAVKVDALGQADLAGAGEPCIGILQNKPGLGEAAQVRVYGVTDMVAGAPIAPGAPVAADAAHCAKAAVLSAVDTSDAGVAADPVIGSNVIGIALTGAAAPGEIISVLLTHGGAVPTTAA